MYGIFNKDFSGFEAIIGRYYPDRLNIFVDTDPPQISMTELPEKKENKVMYHKKFHHWQILMTSYGQLKRMSFRVASNEIIGLWINSTEKYINNIEDIMEISSGVKMND